MASGKSLVLYLALAVVLLILVLDFLLLEGRKTITERLPVANRADGFRGSVAVSDLLYNDRKKSATAVLELEVRPIGKDQEIRVVEYGYQLGTDGSLDLFNCTNRMKECFSLYEEASGPKGPRISTAKIRRREAQIRLTEERSEIWYPFDRLSFQLDFDGSVNGDVAGAVPISNLAFEKLSVEDSEPNYVLRKDSDRYLLVRIPFIRIVSIILLLLSVLFLFYLIRISVPKDLLTQALGFFGALWALRSLLLPSTVTLFPTVVDYVILTEFCLLFTVVISRVTLTTKVSTTT